MNTEEELKELAQNMFKEHRGFLLDQKPHNDELDAYVRRIRLRLLELRNQRGLRHKPND